MPGITIFSVPLCTLGCVPLGSGYASVVVVVPSGCICDLKIIVSASVIFLLKIGNENDPMPYSSMYAIAVNILEMGICSN